MGKLFQIHESDLAELEHALPELLSASDRHLDARQRTQWRRVIEIVKNVRWDYGPHEQVGVVPAEGE